MIGSIKAVFTGVSKFFGWLNNRQLINAGVEKERARTNSSINDNVSKANEAVISLQDPAERERVRKRFERRE